MPAPPAKAEISATYPNPSNSTARIGFGKLWETLFGTGGLLGSTGEKADARAALGLGTGVVLLRTTVYTRAGGVQQVSIDGGAPTTTGASTFTKQAITAFADIEVEGAGGGAGGNPTTTGSQQAFSSGGGGGSYGIGRFTTGLEGIAIVVGAAGLAGTAGAAGGTGGASSAGALISAPGGLGSAAGIASGGVGSTGGTAGGALPTGANILARAGGASLQVLGAGLGFVSSLAGGLSGSGAPNSYGVGAPGKYNGVSTASPQVGIAAPYDGRVTIKEYA